MSIKKKTPDFQLRKVSPLTITQEQAFEAYNQGSHMVMCGCAGTGKTFVAMYLGLREILSGNSEYDKMVIIRSAVPSRDIGFMPGSAKEKARVYEEPYKEICDNLFGRGDGYDILKMKKLVNFCTTSYLRGVTFNNALVIVDEGQNCNYHEIYTIVTRLGENSRFIFCGDWKQTDLKNSGLIKFLKIAKTLDEFVFIEFKIEDIVRSNFVKKYLIAEDTIEAHERISFAKYKDEVPFHLQND